MKKVLGNSKRKLGKKKDNITISRDVSAVHHARPPLPNYIGCRETQGYLRNYNVRLLLIERHLPRWCHVSVFLFVPAATPHLNGCLVPSVD